MTLSPNTRAALFMAVSMAGFTFNDALTKTVIADMNAAQVMFVRGTFATVLIGVLALHGGVFSSLGSLRRPLVAVRALGEVGSTLCFLAALSQMPLANVSAILQALPLAVTMGAALFMSEPVGWRRWSAILVGFAGVMIIVRPGFEGFNSYSLLALLCVAFCALRDLITRRIPDEVPSLAISFATALFVTIAGAVLVVPYGGWTELTVSSTSRLLAAAVLVIVGYQFIIMAMRAGDISFVAPFRYTALVWAILLGFVMFGEVPDVAMILGASIVVASGLYTLYRERNAGKTQPAAETTGPAMAPDGV
ncbi:EamA family transporter [Aliihoeflea aestuarii]|uniref:DMT family transporter n=1 Tax=Aliihoeflea aestuarii TaxID=453840 RepID=UPI002093ABFD|nr:DMT family transporter [Aliihoeflea aestuarii]MCO6390303.1 EamA family transporter [Aliihoeflea aestuarii]